MSSSDDQGQFYLPLFKAFLSDNSLNEVTKFFKLLLTTTQPNPIFANLHKRSAQEKDVIVEAIKFSNSILEFITENTEQNMEYIATAINAFGLSLSFEVNDLSVALNDLFVAFKKSKIYSQLISLDWQVSVIDRKNDNVNLSKAEKIEIVTKINAYNAKDQNCHSHLIKMNFNEFQEILTNFKKIDGQLHLFKQ